jgi:hypothetical protein
MPLPPIYWLGSVLYCRRCYLQNIYNTATSLLYIFLFKKSPLAYSLPGLNILIACFIAHENVRIILLAQEESSALADIKILCMAESRLLISGANGQPCQIFIILLH